MNNVLKKIKALNIGKKNIVLIILAVVMLFVVFLSEFLSNPETTSSLNEDGSVNSQKYIQQTEKELEMILEKINGAGKVQVMLTLESSYENVFAKVYSTKEDKGETDEKKEFQEEYIIIKNGSSNEECLDVKVYEPAIKGVAVVAQGADNIKVKNAITQTVCALFNISSARVSVEKMS
jgi:stage III sporulation protein AG